MPRTCFLRHSIALSVLLVAMSSGPADAQQPPVASVRAAQFEADALMLVGRMTLEEKAAQLKSDASAIPRLGVPAYNWWSEGLHGVARAGEATVFPQAVGLAATFNVPLVRKVADVISTEFRAKYHESVAPDGGSALYRGLTVWSPNVNIFRDPRWGRGQETFGEDPYLTSRMGIAFIDGLQGSDPTYYKTLAVVKHFAVHSGPEADRHKENVTPSPYDLEATYLPAFRATVTRAHPGGVMCAYNAIDGIPACASPLLDNRLRKDWGFSGHIVTDCSAMVDFFRSDAHGYSPSPEAAIATAVHAGTDLLCSAFGDNASSDPAIIVAAVRKGLLPETELDRSIVRLMTARMQLGILGPRDASRYANIAPAENDTAAHADLNRQVARESLVLLKNDGLLPLKATPKSIAVIGPNANSLDALVGNYAGTPSRPRTLVTGLRERYPDAKITFVEGTGTIGAPLAEVADDVLCVDAACKAHGLKVEEYSGHSLMAKPVRTGIDANARFAWGRPKRIERQSVLRWSGYITPDETGPYRFRLESENGYRVMIDGREVVGAWDAADPSTIADGEIQLSAGRRYGIVIEAKQSGSRGDQKLLWSNFSQREEAAIAAARSADLVVFAAGLNQRVEGEEMRVHAAGFAGGDRTSLDLPEPQQRLLEQVHATGKPVILVLMNGSALSINWADRTIPAIVEAWYPGGEGGRAIADLIAGDFSPAGRLPVTFYASADQLPPFKDYAMRGRTYRYFAGKPLYPFGYGLSYTQFRYDGLRLSLSRMRPGQTTQLSVNITNVGGRDGDEVVQLYLSRRNDNGLLRSLKGVERVHLARGETRTVTFTLDDEALSDVDNIGLRNVPSGPVEIWVGGGQPGHDNAPASGQAVTVLVKG